MMRILPLGEFFDKRAFPDATRALDKKSPGAFCLAFPFFHAVIGSSFE